MERLDLRHAGGERNSGLHRTVERAASDKGAIVTRRVLLSCMRIVVALLALLPTTLVAAQAPVYKCRGAGGPVYQDSPCREGHSLRDFDADPPPLSVVPFERPRERASAHAARPPRPAKAPSSSRQAGASPAGDPAERRHVKEGMSEGEVLARLGAPDFKAGKRWTYLPVAGDPQTVTIVRFEDGSVRTVERRVLN
jgi:hypothetical protein